MLCIENSCRHCGHTLIESLDIFHSFSPIFFWCGGEVSILMLAVANRVPAIFTGIIVNDIIIVMTRFRRISTALQALNVFVVIFVIVVCSARGGLAKLRSSCGSDRSASISSWSWRRRVLTIVIQGELGFHNVDVILMWSGDGRRCFSFSFYLAVALTAGDVDTKTQNSVFLSMTWRRGNVV